MTVPALFYGAFKLSATGLGATGLTVTVDVDRILKSDATKTNLITAGAATTECRNGVYAYLLAGADFLLYDYLVTFKTVATTVVDKEIQAWRGSADDGMVSPVERTAIAASVWTRDISGIVSSNHAEGYLQNIRTDVEITGVLVGSFTPDSITAAAFADGAITSPDNAGIGVAAAASVSAASGVATLLVRITSTIFTGITSLGGWLRILARKDAAAAADYAGSLTEINADGGTGAGGFTNISESLEAIASEVADIEISPVLVISSTAPELQTLAANGTLTIHRGDYTTFDLILGSLVGRTGKKLIFTIKPTKDDRTDDILAYLQITEVDGAVLVNGSSDGVTAADASMTVIDENTGQTRFAIKGEITDLLPIGTNFWYDAQMIDSVGQPRTKTEDRAVVDRDVTRRSS